MKLSVFYLSSSEEGYSASYLSDMGMVKGINEIIEIIEKNGA
jgi:hypothetical protein